MIHDHYASLTPLFFIILKFGGDKLDGSMLRNTAKSVRGKSLKDENLVQFSTSASTTCFPIILVTPEENKGLVN